VLAAAALLCGARAISGAYSPPWGLLLGYQRELRFLHRHLGAVEPACPVVAMGVSPIASGPFYADDVLALPHPVLAFSHRELRWRVLGPRRPEPRLCGLRCAYYYAGSMCPRLDVVLDEGLPVDSPRELVHRARRSCHALREAAVQTVAVEPGPGLVLHGEAPPDHYPGGRLELGLFRIDPSPWQRGCDPTAAP